MRKRNISFLVRLTAEENERLDSQIKLSGLSREAFIRSLIGGYIPRPLPSIDYFSLLRELHAIGNNLNQLAAKANAVGHIDTTVFQYEAKRLRLAVQEIQEAFIAPERRNESGDNGHLGCERPP